MSVEAKDKVKNESFFHFLGMSCHHLITKALPIKTLAKSAEHSVSVESQTRDCHSLHETMHHNCVQLLTKTPHNFPKRKFLLTKLNQSNIDIVRHKGTHWHKLLHVRLKALTDMPKH